MQIPSNQSLVTDYDVFQLLIYPCRSLVLSGAH